MSEDGIRKCAILLMSIGEDEAAEVLKYMGPKEVQKISAYMATLENVTRDEIQIALKELLDEAQERTTLGMAADGYIRSMLTKALGDDKAAGLIDRILQGGGWMVRRLLK